MPPKRVVSSGPPDLGIQLKIEIDKVAAHPPSLSLSVSDHPELCHSMDTDTEDGGPPTPGGFGSAEPTLPPPSPLVLEKKKRRFIVVNDMEIPLDDD